MKRALCKEVIRALSSSKDGIFTNLHINLFIYGFVFTFIGAGNVIVLWMVIFESVDEISILWPLKQQHGFTGLLNLYLKRRY